MRYPRPCRVVFDGQSRVWSPSGEKWGTGTFAYPNFNFPRFLMAGRRLPWYIPAVSGQSFTWLYNNWLDRVDSINANEAVVSPEIEPTIYILCGGHSDYYTELNTGPQVYADAGALANRARAYGAQYVIATTTIDSIGFTGSIRTNWFNGNTLMMADASNYFDAQVDLRAVPELDDPTDTDYFFDGVHQYGQACVAIADAIAPYLDAAIAAVT